MEVYSVVDQVVPAPNSRRDGSRNAARQQPTEDRSQYSGTSTREFKGPISYKEGVYVGTISNSAPNGAGMYRTPSGLLYVGEFSNGVFCGFGEMKKPGRVFKGQFLRGEMSGIGSIKTKKSSAVAQFFNDKKHGVAVIYNNDKSQNMEGYYKEGETRGFCIVTDPTKQVVLSGMFEKTVLNGIGKEENSQIVFLGNFRNNKKWGLGKINYLETDVTYSGSWKEDLRDGFGVLYDPVNQETYEGSFIKDHKQGTGLLRSHTKKATYIGRFEQDHYEGPGKLEFSSSFYLGNFHKSQRSGLGYERTQQEEMYFGYWRDDKRDGIGLDKNPDREYLGEWSKDLPHGRGLITIDGHQKAAIYDHGKPTGLLPDSAIPELEQQFNSLNFEKFIHPMSKCIEGYYYQIEANKHDLCQQVEHIERSFESVLSRLQSDIRKLEQENLAVQEGCNRMAQALDSVFRTNGLELRVLATVPYSELLSQLKQQATQKKSAEKRKSVSRGDTVPQEVKNNPSPTQNLQVANPILNNSMRFDSGEVGEETARVTPSLTMQGGDPGRFLEYKTGQTPPKKDEMLEVPQIPRKQGQKRISMSEVAPVTQRKPGSRSPEKKYDSLAHSRLTTIQSRQDRSKSKKAAGGKLSKSKLVEKKPSREIDDEDVGFICNRKGVTAKLTQQKYLNSSSQQNKISKFEEDERAKRVEAERKELHARRRAGYKPSPSYNQEQEGEISNPNTYNFEDRKILNQPESEIQRTFNPQSVPDTDALQLAHDSNPNHDKGLGELNLVPKAKIHSSLLVSQFSLAQPDLNPSEQETQNNAEAYSKPQNPKYDDPDSPHSPEFGSVKFVPIKEFPKVLDGSPLNLNPKPQTPVFQWL